jgi:hypothetical protein
MKARMPTDKVRASRDGHEFHEVWVARRAMQLLWPDSPLSALAIEGLSPTDQPGAESATVEVADVTLYFAGEPSFELAAKTTIAQFKYSIASAAKDFRAADAAETVAKFAETYRTYKKRHGAAQVHERLDFQLVTNRPASDALLKALDALTTGAACKGDVKRQADQIRNASRLSGKQLASFASKLRVIGRSSNLPTAKNELASLLVDWSSAGSDPIAMARLGTLRQLVRDKAGHAGTGNNVIRRTDLLAALQIGDQKELLPCEAAVSDVGVILERVQLADAEAQLKRTSSPLLVHAAGGVGKTVFLESLAARLAPDCEIVFFDCFGGGSYRSPEDARHLPKRGLIHIANTLAFRGLCDPMLPDSNDLQSLLATFRRRLRQAVAAVSQVTPGRTVAIFIDAIDNAEIVAGRRMEDCFPIKLLESLDADPLPGLKVVVSCRTERKPQTHARYQELKLRPFDGAETASFLRSRVKGVTASEINVGLARSAGNARVLDYLVKAGRALLAPSEITNTIELDELIEKRIIDALHAATERGSDENDVKAFLAGLAVLPPPVPLDEYAGAHGLDLAAIESFASDLSPLIERTSHGIMFRDEPTETFVEQNYAASSESLERVAKNLDTRQQVSVYAARSLPGLLQQLGAGERLFELAFDPRTPSSIGSAVGKRNIRYARLKAATLYAAKNCDYNKLVRLLIELSTVAAVDERGANYILDHPDLMVGAEDVDARRRLFEAKTSWPGTRHARLAIAHTIAGEAEEANRHAHAADEWIEHFLRSDTENRTREQSPGELDVAAIPLFLVSQGLCGRAAAYLGRWRDWFSYEVCKHVCELAHLARDFRGGSKSQLGGFIRELSGIGPLAAALSFDGVSPTQRSNLVVKLAAACQSASELNLPNRYRRRRENELEDGLRKASILALYLGHGPSGVKIARRIRHEVPRVLGYRDAFDHRGVLAHIFRVAIVAASKGRSVHEKDLLPVELASICSRIPKTLSGAAFRKKAKSLLEQHAARRHGQADTVAEQGLTYDERQYAERFLDTRLEPLVELSAALASMLSASPRNVDARFVALLNSWSSVRRSRDRYSDRDFDRLFDALGREAAILFLWAHRGLKIESVRRFVAVMLAHNPIASDLVKSVGILSMRPAHHPVAGELALRARSLIEREGDVNERASLFGALGRAMLPAGREEAAAYFKTGLEEMDAIGSGDYAFVNELLLLVSESKGPELSEADFHTLTNICELNMGEEPEKFYWGAYGRGLARASGLRGLAKLSRWDDRSKVSLKNTLLPYLTGLLEFGKIEPRDAVALNYLANPVEYYGANTQHFVGALRNHGGLDREVVAELIEQFERDNPSLAGDETVDSLNALAKAVLGPAHGTTQRIEGLRARYSVARSGRNRQYGSRSASDRVGERRGVNEQNRRALARIAAATDPLSDQSLAEAIAKFNALGNMYDLKGEFFAALRAKVPFAERGRYVRNVSALKDLFYYWKLAELKQARDAWSKSSLALKDVYKSLAFPLVLAHADDLVSDGRVSGSNIKEISDFTETSMGELVLELIKVFARPDRSVPGSVWLAFATFVAREADDGHAQLGLSRLLSSDQARLASSVVDGPWKLGLYTREDAAEIAAGLIWRSLGSPAADSRWRACHTLRAYAKFGRWDVVDLVVRMVNLTGAGAFQASELDFYYLHSRLWLLIALARLAINYPQEIARYQDMLCLIAAETSNPHVLMQKFAADALMSCAEAGSLRPVAVAGFDLAGVAKSPLPKSGKKVGYRGDFYRGRPDEAQKRPFEFYLDYDFHKHDVDALAEVFGMPCWEVADMMADVAHDLAPKLTAMHEDGGREIPGGRQSTSRHHGYGFYIGWHALFFVAGRLLATRPVLEREWYDTDAWLDWLGRYSLTRSDGLWLSDGCDRTPIDSAIELLEPGTGGLKLTGLKSKLLGLTKTKNERSQAEVVVEARWYSTDGVRIDISSALVPPGRARALAKKVLEEEPIIAWLPSFRDSEDDDEFARGEMKEYAPWIACPSGESRLDEHDPYGVSDANTRPRLAQRNVTLCKLSLGDPFGRSWLDSEGRVAVRAEAWGRDESDYQRTSRPGVRLSCHPRVLKSLLKKRHMDLLVLIKLQRHEKRHQEPDTYNHTLAVLHVDRTLAVKYYRGPVDHLHKSRF